MGTTTLDITHTLIIEGEGGMGFGSAGMGTACRMRWDAGATGIRVQAYNTSGASTVDGSPHFSGAFTTINNISLEGPVADNGLLSLHGLVEGEFHGIHAKSLVQLNNCIVAGFQGDGLYSHTTAGGGSPDEGASNASRAYNCWFTANRNGVSLGGADSNVWTFIGCQATFNRACGVDDSAFLTNTHIGWHTSGNGGYLDNDGTANFPAYTVADGGSHYSVIQGQETNASTNRPKTSAVTITIASPGVVSWTAHGLPEGTLVTFSTTGALPTGLAANTSYYVVNPNANDFQLANTRGGTAINTSGSQSGTHRAGAALDNAYWYYVRAGGVDLSSGVPAWSSGIHLRVAAPIRTPETSAGTVIINFYAEQNQGCIQAGNSTIMIGGTIPVPVKGSVSWQRNVSGFLTLPKLNVTDFMSSIAQNIQLGPQYDAPVSDTDVRWHTTDTNITMQWQSWSALAPRTEYTLTINKNNGVVSTARVAHYFKVTGSSYNWEILLGAGTVGFFGSFGAGRQTVTGSRGGNAALADLLTKLANLGIITDGTT
jgi:hypothetical protein